MKHAWGNQILVLHKIISDFLQVWAVMEVDAEKGCEGRPKTSDKWGSIFRVRRKIAAMDSKMKR
jgi:hypothetical protein